MSDGVPIRRVPKGTIAKLAAKQGVGLWAESSYFEHTREMRTTDPSDYELELGMEQPRGVAWCTPLRERKHRYRTVV